VFVTHDLYSGILILKTVVLVSHGGKEHILNAETKKKRVCHLIFTNTEKESMNPELAENRTK
jgi:hypothetical protein